MRASLTPLDGRYYDRVSALVPFLSENALIHYRVLVEVEWLKFLSRTVKQPLDKKLEKYLDALSEEFSDERADQVRLIEKNVNHDVKAVELWIAQQLNSEGFGSVVSMVHFGRTSEDINNLAYSLMLRDAKQKVLLPALRQIQGAVSELASKNADAAMMSRTHGQPATPTTFGKECAVFAYRLQQQIEAIDSVKILGKCSGATGTFAADLIAYPDVDWPLQMQAFVESLGLVYNPITTQIDSHDWIARLNNDFALAATICIDLARDFWQYISIGYLTQTVNENEVGSSTMPHKVNPIDFENAEANLGVANALLRHLSEKLPISRLQRDLSDSSALRALSEAYGHYLLALVALAKGISKVQANPAAMTKDLEAEWMLLTEAIQTVMRKNGVADAYDQMKKLSRGKTVGQEELREFITGLGINEDDKQRLLALTPETYIGYASELAHKADKK